MLCVFHFAEKVSLQREVSNESRERNPADIRSWPDHEFCKSLRSLRLHDCIHGFYLEPICT